MPRKSNKPLHPVANMAIDHHQAVLFSTISTELDTGLRLSRLALSSNDPDKVARNTSNAQRAYDAAQRWARKLPAEYSKDLDDPFRQLKANLKKLGRK